MFNFHSRDLSPTELTSSRSFRGYNKQTTFYIIHQCIKIMAFSEEAGVFFSRYSGIECKDHNKKI